MTTSSLLIVSAALLGAGAVASLAAARRRRVSGCIATGFAIATAVVVWIAVLRTFAAGADSPVRWFEVSMLGAGLTVGVDALSALFLAIAVTIAVLATAFSIDYMTHFEDDGVAKFYPVLMLFYLGIIGVLVTTDLFFFLVFWELMTLSSFFLVTYERHSQRSQRAGLKYFIITHAATLCMIAAALILWRRSHSFEFAALRDALEVLLATNPVLGHLVVFLFVLGFATKAGILPMGAWLPDAHPVAPSGISAVLSGVLVKLGIYGLCRLFFTLIPVSPTLEVWGVILALAGTGSLFVGTLTALQQTDSKRLMAFHTIGQIGYIVLGLGVGIYYLPTDRALASLALLGALLHTINHACFKACLFLGAGAVLFRTGERDMDRLGGLGRKMPITAASSTVAALAISGVPPLNGFASKWLIVASCLLAGASFPLFLVLGLVAAFASLATLASFLKVLGSVFLGGAGRDRNVAEVPATMWVPQAVLAGLCVLFGLAPQLALDWVGTAVAGAAAVPLPPLAEVLGGPWGLSLGGDAAVGMWMPLVLVSAFGVLAAAAFGIQRLGGARVREVPVWTCGEEHDPALVSYRASSFYHPVKHALRGLYPRFQVPAPKFPGWLRRSFAVDNWLYTPMGRGVTTAARGAAKTHVGTPQVYLLWIVVGAIAVVGLLVVVLT